MRMGPAHRRLKVFVEFVQGIVPDLNASPVMTHYESDYGAAPKIDMRVGQHLASIIPRLRR